MTYIYMPSGAECWSEVPHALARLYGTKPSMWLQYPPTLASAKDFPACTIYNFWDIEQARLPKGYSPSHSLSPSLLSPQEFARLRARVTRLMDREDVLGGYRLVDREAVFYSLYWFFAQELARLKPAFLLAAEAPHWPAQCIVYSLCRQLSIPTVIGSSASQWPIMFLKESIESRPWSFPFRLLPQQVLDRYKSEISAYCDDLSADSYDLIESRAMRQQRDEDQRLRSRRGSVGRVISSTLARITGPDVGAELALKAYPFADSTTISPGMGSRREPQDLGRLSALVRGIVFSRRRETWERRVRERQGDALSSSTSPLPKSPFVSYFLHFEPERTSNPDGGDYYNQYDAIASLRNILPPHVSLVVKEHPTQFRVQKAGHLARSPQFYGALLALPGVTVASHDVNPSDLVRRSQFVATLTGTVALEAACLGTPALLFGNPWFAGCPGTIVWNDEIGYHAIAELPSASLEDIAGFIYCLVQDCGIPALISPTFESYFSDSSWVSDSNTAMAECITQACMTILAAVETETDSTEARGGLG